MANITRHDNNRSSIYTTSHSRYVGDSNRLLPEQAECSNMVRMADPKYIPGSIRFNDHIQLPVPASSIVRRVTYVI